jgi:hypothetical protein
VSVKLLMLGTTPLRPKRANGRNIRLKPLFLSMIRLRRQLNERMQRNLHPRTLLLRNIHIVSVDTPKDRLMGNDDDILAALEFHDDRLEADDDVAVALAAAVAVVVLVVVAGAEVFGELVLDLLVGEAVADAGVELVERFPFQLVVALGRFGEEAGGLDGAFEGRGPDGEFAAFGGGLRHQVWEGAGVGFAALGDVGVAADFAVEVESRFSVL